MFTGIIQDIGQVKEIKLQDQSMQLCISTSLSPEHLCIGASVSCNGCCLTVVKANENNFFVDIGPQTLGMTSFSNIKIGDKINLEPALRVGDALGGHQVSGHVDGTFELVALQKISEEFWKLSLLIPNQFAKFMIPKGSIAVLGISLTIANISTHPKDSVLVDFMIIPHTFHNTILQFISAENRRIEVEFDQSTKAIASLFEGMIFNYIQMNK